MICYALCQTDYIFLQIQKVHIGKVRIVLYR